MGRGDGMGLQVVLHLEAMLDIPKEAICAGKQFRFFRRKPFVLGKFFEARYGLRPLKKRLAARMKELESLGNEFDFADAPAAQFPVALQLAAFYHFIFDAL